MIDSTVWTSAPTIAVALAAAARAEHRDRRQLRALGVDGGIVAELSASQWDARARGVAHALEAVAAPGDRVILPAMSGLDFHIGFLACLYAGMIAVPVPDVPRQQRPTGVPDRREQRLQGIIRDCDARAMVVNAETDLDAVAAGVACVDVVQPEASPDWEPHASSRDPETVALLQYTSGSTSEPRGVIITHGNLVANRADTRDRAEVTPGTTAVLWLPLFHDMGLASSVVLPLVSGAQVVSMDPMTFVRNPMVWLRAISGERDALTSAPDFAFHMCVARVTDEERATLDLSGWRVAVNGSEPVQAATLERFAHAFAPCGFRANALRPSYGLAECTLAVSMGLPLTEVVVRSYDRASLAEGKALPAERSESSVEVVGCGHATDRVTLLIVDPDTGERLPEQQVGEVWVHSPSNGKGYWNRPEETAEVFQAVPADEPADRWFVRTGDLGFLDGEELFIAGRRKDVLIIGGENYYPQDAEAVAKDAHAAFAHQVCAAWPLGDGDASKIGVVVETDERDPDVLAEAVRAAALAVSRTLPAVVVAFAVPRYAIPRTTSGKLQRRLCARLCDEGALQVLAQWATA